MKKYILTIIICTLTVLSYAQHKLGYINSEELISLMPEAKQAESELEDMQKNADATYKAMLQEYQNKAIAYQNDAENLKGASLEARQKEILDLENRIAQFEQSSQQQFQEKYIELLKPIQEKALNAINDVAEKEKYTYIFDISKGNILFYENGDNILPLVKKKLKL
tara:strand:- start:394 stop:891 length:498 start_codon:yes stop_codon:yes gene_type:complete